MPLGRPPAALTLRERAQVALDSHISTENQKLAERRLELWTEQLKVSAADVLRCWSEELELKSLMSERSLAPRHTPGPLYHGEFRVYAGKRMAPQVGLELQPSVNSRKIKPGVRVHSMT